MFKDCRGGIKDRQEVTSASHGPGLPGRGSLGPGSLGLGSAGSTLYFPVHVTPPVDGRSFPLDFGRLT